MTAQDNSGVPSWAVRGAKVVCIRGALRSSRTRGGWCPQTGGIYTIDRAFVNSLGATTELLIALQEYVHDEADWGWCLARFRPAALRKTEAEDLAQFRKFLTVRQPEGADA